VCEIAIALYEAKQETSMKQVASTDYFTCCFLLGLFFELEDEGDMFFRNVG
jgi:hypothetical protein